MSSQKAAAVPLIFLISLLVVGCSNLPAVQTAATVATGVAVGVNALISGKTYAAQEQERQANAPFRANDAEERCIRALPGSFDKWPDICAHTNLSKVDMCGRAGFLSTPLCEEHRQQVLARYPHLRQQMQPTPQPVYQTPRSSPSPERRAERKAEKKAEPAKAAVSPQVVPAIFTTTAPAKAQRAKKKAPAQKLEIEEPTYLDSVGQRIKEIFTF